jgi:hypothetical protein
MFVVSVVLSGRGLCDEMITRPEESYRLWCVVVCDLETSRTRPWPALNLSERERERERGKKTHTHTHTRPIVHSCRHSKSSAGVPSKCVEKRHSCTAPIRTEMAAEKKKLFYSPM